MSTPRLLICMEGAVMLAFCIFAYAVRHGSPWLFLSLLFVPDLSMLGYLVNARVGARAYNAVHTEIGPLLAGMVCVLTQHYGGVLLCLIWLAHIGLDRMLGYGLKYETGFKGTHIQRL